MSTRTGIPLRIADSPGDACRDADIICTVTPSIEPVIDLADVKEGAHINAVGACRPSAREIGADLMAASRIFVDQLEAALVEAGDILLAIQEGSITKEHILGEVGRVLSGEMTGRRNEKDITFFE